MAPEAGFGDESVSDTFERARILRQINLDSSVGALSLGRKRVDYFPRCFFLCETQIYSPT